MVIPIEEARRRYGDYIEAIESLRKNLRRMGIDIEQEDEFELGGSWNLVFSGQILANLEWNVPYYLTYSVKVVGFEGDSFELDNVKNIRDWQMFLKETSRSLAILRRASIPGDYDVRKRSEDKGLSRLFALVKKGVGRDEETELSEAIDLYRKFKLDGKPVRHDTMGLHEETVVSRAAIHDMLLAMGPRAKKYAAELKKIDRDWQDWVSNNKDKDFELVGMNREGEPKSEWWFWIDQLENLSNEERDTL